MAEGETEYESDSEESKVSLTMRRREASDDEENEEDDDCVEEGRTEPRRAVIVSEYESDGQGAAADYDDDEELEIDKNEECEEMVGDADGDVAVEAVVVEFDSVQGAIDEEYYASDGGERGEQDKKENDPFLVPTVGAFYMHDDRFRDSAAARHRSTPGGCKLWESKDDRKWGHDKFEEMTMKGRHYDEDRRGSRGNFRARGRGRGRGEGNRYSNPNNPKAAYIHNTDRNATTSNNSNSNRPKAAYLHNSDKNATSSNNAPKAVRGRGPIRYQPSMVNDYEVPTPNRRLGKSTVEKMSNRSYSGRMHSSDVDPNAFDSSLSSASPPFYPSGSSSNKETRLRSKRDSQIPTNRNLPPDAVREKNVPDLISMEKLHIDEPYSRKPLNNMQLTQSRGVDQVAYQNLKPRNKVSFGVSTPSHSIPAQGQLLHQRSGSGSHDLSPHTRSAHSFESEDTEYLSETASVGKGNGSLQGRLSANFPYHADQNFPGTPSFLPLMQFGGQHQGGVGVPLGMAFPGYVAQQQQHGLSNPDMTWLPLLAGAAEAALGATYRSSPPYPPPDGLPSSYHNLHSSPFSIPRKENVIARPSGGLKPSQRPSELVNDEFGLQQTKPRRYTEMRFDQ